MITFIMDQPAYVRIPQLGWGHTDRHANAGRQRPCVAKKKGNRLAPSPAFRVTILEIEAQRHLHLARAAADLFREANFNCHSGSLLRTL